MFRVLVKLNTEERSDVQEGFLIGKILGLDQKCAGFLITVIPSMGKQVYSKILPWRKQTLITWENASARG